MSMSQPSWGTSDVPSRECEHDTRCQDPQSRKCQTIVRRSGKALCTMHAVRSRPRSSTGHKGYWRYRHQACIMRHTQRNLGRPLLIGDVTTFETRSKGFLAWNTTPEACGFPAYVFPCYLI